jgi:hypothetical protein
MREIIEKKKNCQYLSWLFSSFPEFITMATSGTFPHKNYTQPDPHKRQSRDNGVGRVTRCGGTWDEVTKLANLGWLSKLQDMREFKDMLVTRLGRRIKKKRWVNDVTGSDLDLGRYFAGTPDCWITPEETIQKGISKKLVHVTINIACPCDISQHLIEERGLVIGALIELLEFSGRRCKVTVFNNVGSPYHNHKFQTLFGVVVKDFHHTLNMGRTLFAVAHSGMLRRLGFSIMEQFPPKFAKGAKVGMTYGYPTAIPLKFRGDIHLDKEFYTGTQFDPFEYLLKELKSQQIEFIS